MLSFTKFLNETSETTRTTVKPKNKSELMKIIKGAIKKEGNNCDLNFIDTSLIDDMSKLFRESEFNGDISKWDVSNVKSIDGMFENSPLEGREPDWCEEKN